MHRLPTQRWTHDGRTYSVALIVEDNKVTGITPVKIVVHKGCKNCNGQAEPQPELASAT